MPTKKTTITPRAAAKTRVSSAQTQSGKINVFNAEVSPNLITQAIHVYQANSHRGVSKVKTRGEVAISTRKIYKQKGTGNARHGAKSAPIFVGGGVVFGPRGIKTPLKSLNQKMKLKALAGILNVYQKENRLSLLDSASLKGVSTKQADKLLRQDLGGQSCSVVHYREDPQFLKSVNNLSGIDLNVANRLNVLKVAEHQKVLLTPNALDHLTEKLAKISSIKPAK